MGDKLVNVFVYGTLKIGGNFADKFDKFREKSEEASIKGTMFDCGWYPCIIMDDKNTIHGELHTYKNAEEVIKALDLIEGYTPDLDGNLYNRKSIEVTTISGETEKAMVYEWVNKETARKFFKIIKNGRWEI